MMDGKHAIRAMLFDMDGVIVDTEHIHEQAFRDALLSYGIDMTHRMFLEYFFGQTDQDGLTNLSAAFGLDISVQKLLTEKQAAYFKSFLKSGRLYPHVEDLLEELATSYRLALVSNSGRAEVDFIVEMFTLGRYFGTTVSCDDVSMGKPSPEPYLKASKLLRAEPSTCVVVEDSKVGIQSAKAAGMRCIAVTTTHAKEDLEDADAVIEAVSQISVLL